VAKVDELMALVDALETQLAARQLHHAFQEGKIQPFIIHPSSFILVLKSLAHFQTLPLKDATRQLHHAFQEIENKPFIIPPSSFILFTMLGSTLSNDQLPDKRFDFQFVNPPYGDEWSKDYDAVNTREPMQNNPSVRQRLGQRGIETHFVDRKVALPSQLFRGMENFNVALAA